MIEEFTLDDLKSLERMLLRFLYRNKDFDYTIKWHINRVLDVIIDEQIELERK